MKKTLILLVAALALAAPKSHAQNVLDLLKKGSSSSTTDSGNSGGSNALSGLGDFVAGLLGTGKVNANTLVGTWNYKQPAIAFESKNMLTNVGSMAAGKAAEQKLQTYLDKIGFTAGKVSFTFNQDGTGQVIYSGKKLPFQWSIENSDLTINLAGKTVSQLTSGKSLGKYTSFKMNCKVTLNNMQLAFKADKLAEFLGKVVSAAGNATNNSTISSVAGLASKVDGMYIGLTLNK